MPKLPVNQLSRGSAINLDGEVYVIVGMDHVKPGKGPAYQQIKLKGLENGKVIEKRYRTADTVDTVELDRQICTFSYRSGDMFIFMNKKTYEEQEVHRDVIGDQERYLLENNEVTLMIAQGKIVSVELPDSVSLKVIECEPGVKHATATNVYKGAKLETGVEAQVPPFISVGDVVKIEVATGKYLERTSIG